MTRHVPFGPSTCRIGNTGNGKDVNLWFSKVFAFCALAYLIFANPLLPRPPSLLFLQKITLCILSFLLPPLFQARSRISCSNLNEELPSFPLPLSRSQQPQALLIADNYSRNLYFSTMPPFLTLERKQRPFWSFFGLFHICDVANTKSTVASHLLDRRSFFKKKIFSLSFCPTTAHNSKGHI